MLVTDVQKPEGIPGDQPGVSRARAGAAILDSTRPSPLRLASMHRQHTTTRPSTDPSTDPSTCPPNYNPKGWLRVMDVDREPSCRSQPISTPARCDGQRNAALIPGRQSTRPCAGHRVQACESCRRQRCTGRRPPIIRCVPATAATAVTTTATTTTSTTTPTPTPPTRSAQTPRRRRNCKADRTERHTSACLIRYVAVARAPVSSSLGFPCSHRGRLASRRRAKITQRQPLPGTAISRLSRQLSSHPLCLHSSPALANIGALRPVYHPLFPPSFFLGCRPHQRCARSSYAPCNFTSGPGNFTPVLRGYTGFRRQTGLHLIAPSLPGPLPSPPLPHPRPVSPIYFLS
jgi:hypothetical protein